VTEASVVHGGLTKEGALDFASSFPRQEGLIPLNNAALTPLSRNAADVMTRTMAEMMRPDDAMRRRWVEGYEAAHVTFGELLGCEPGEVTFMANVATAMSILAHALGLAPGDEIVTVDQEYGSNAYPWNEAAARAGARVVRAASRDDRSVDTREVARLVGPRTRVVAVSWVQFQTGATLDLHHLSRVCLEHGALLVADATQGVGVAPFSMAQSGVDVVAGSMHKWLGGPPGLAYLAVRQSRIESLRPQVVGPYSYGEVASGYEPKARLLATAARLRSGTPPLIPILGAAAAARAVLDCGVPSISARVLSLAEMLRLALVEQGHRVLSPAAMTSPIVTFVPRQGPQAAAHALAAHGITFALRGGGLRLSPHFFNTSDDVALVAEVLAGRHTPLADRNDSSYHQ
jgi:selenocysteine lyase/cysteine desulfurase